MSPPTLSSHCITRQLLHIMQAWVKQTHTTIPSLPIAEQIAQRWEVNMKASAKQWSATTFFQQILKLVANIPTAKTRLLCWCTDEASTVTNKMCHAKSIAGLMAWLAGVQEHAQANSITVDSLDKTTTGTVQTHPSKCNHPESDWHDTSVLMAFPTELANKLISFCWPIQKADDLRQFIRSTGCDTMVAFECTGALRDMEWLSNKRLAISVDRKPSTYSGAHAQMDMHELFEFYSWKRVYAHPVCTHNLACSFKPDGRSFWGMQQVIMCYCLKANEVIVEQPITELPKFWKPPCIRTSTGEMGDISDKSITLYTRGVDINALTANHTKAFRKLNEHFSLADFPSQEDAASWRSSWRRYPNTCKALTQCKASPSAHKQNRPRLIMEQQKFAVNWFKHGLPVPADYLSRDARPAKQEERDYQDVRGAGDGRHVLGTLPLTQQAVVDLEQTRRTTHTDKLGQPTADTCRPSHNHTFLPISTATKTVVLLMLATIASSGTVLLMSKANGQEILGAQVPIGHTHSELVTAMTNSISRTSVPILVCKSATGAKIYTALLNYIPEKRSVATSTHERKHKHNLPFLWCTATALASTAIHAPAMIATGMLTAMQRAAPTAISKGLMTTNIDGQQFTWGALRPSQLSGWIATELESPPQHIQPSYGACFMQMEEQWRAQLWSATQKYKGELANDVKAWTECMRPPPWSELPTQLASPQTFHASISTLPYPKPRPKLHTRAVPLMPEQEPVNRCVRSHKDLLPHDTQQRYNSWMRRNNNFIKCLMTMGLACNVTRPAPIAIGPGEQYPWSRYKIYDFRETNGTNCAKLLNFSELLPTHLNVDYLTDWMEKLNYTDLRTKSIIQLGVTYMADIEYMSVLTPHLYSLGKAYDMILSEVERFKSIEWYSTYDNPPFWPIMLLPRGSQPRKLENRDRLICDGNAPRKKIYSKCGIPATSLQTASRTYAIPTHLKIDNRKSIQEYLLKRGLPPSIEDINKINSPPYSKWGNQTMPDIKRVARQLLISRQAGAELDMPVFILGDDFKDFFMNLRHRPEELWKTNMVLQISGQTKFVNEKVMGFGVHPNSKIAQELAELITDIFRHEMDAYDNNIYANTKDSKLLAWLEKRKAVQHKHGGKQNRLYSTEIYCDDNIIIVVGVERTLHAMVTYRRIVQSVNIKMAVVEKRSLGTHMIWLGILFITTLGVLIIPCAKRLRAMQAIRKANTNNITFAEYRSLVGLLEHFRQAIFLPSRTMLLLYKPMQGNEQPPPGHEVPIDNNMKHTLRKWLSILQNKAGASVLTILDKHRKLTTLNNSPMQHYIFSDAATDSNPPGLGGYMQGYVWNIPLTQQQANTLHITCLELIATVISTITFANLLQENAHVILMSDALATAYTLQKDNTASEDMAHVLQLAEASPIFSKLACRCEIAHIYGEANTLSDAASRSMWGVIDSVCNSLKLTPCHIDVPHEALNILTTALNTKHNKIVTEKNMKRRRTSEIQHNKEQDGERIHPHPGPPNATSITNPLLIALGHKVYHHTKCKPHCTVEQQKQQNSMLAAHCSKSTAQPNQPHQHKSKKSSNPLHNQQAQHKPSTTMPRSQEQSFRSKAGMLLPTASGLQLSKSTRREDLLTQVHKNAANHFPANATTHQKEKIMAVATTSFDMAELGAAPSTRQKDDSHWLWWKQCCAEFGWDPFDQLMFTTNKQLLIQRLAMFVVWIYPKIFGKANRRLAKPSTAEQYAFSIIRIYRDRLLYECPKTTKISQACKGLYRIYRETYGAEAVAPHKMQPMTNSIWDRVESLKHNTPLSSTQTWSPRANHMQATVLRAGRVCKLTGHRVSELAEHPFGENMFLTRGNLTLVRRGVPTQQLTITNLRQCTQGDYLLLTPCASKADQFGAKHCPFPSVIPYSSCPRSAWASIRDIEQAQPIPYNQRRTSPLFADTNMKPIPARIFNKTLRLIMTKLIGRDMASQYSFHSFRRGLACALLQAGCPVPVIQMMCRWSCPESVMEYAKLGHKHTKQWLHLASKQEVDATTIRAIPQIDNDHMLWNMMEEPSHPTQHDPEQETNYTTDPREWDTAWQSHTSPSNTVPCNNLVHNHTPLATIESENLAQQCAVHNRTPNNRHGSNGAGTSAAENTTTSKQIQTITPRRTKPRTNARHAPYVVKRSRSYLSIQNNKTKSFTLPPSSKALTTLPAIGTLLMVPRGAKTSHLLPSAEFGGQGLLARVCNTSERKQTITVRLIHALTARGRYTERMSMPYKWAREL